MSTTPQRLWVAWHAPLLSLEAWAASLPEAARLQPLALQAQHRLLAVNAPAQALGVQPGMRRATALALAPGLTLGVADDARDREALLAVVHAALAFSPSVCWAPGPAPGVLIELQASLRCFGGSQRLWQRLADATAPLGLSLRRAWAPTAWGAWLLAQAGDAQPLGDWPTRAEPGWVAAALAALAERLDPLPVELLAPAPAAQETLLATGLRTLAELRRQPRAGLARRLGPELLQRLDQAYGATPDPHDWLQAPLRFETALELAHRTEHHEVLLDATQTLLGRLAAWAAARHARVQRFELRLQHETRLRASAQGEAGPQHSTLAVALAEPSADPVHWRALLRERLAREPLSAPVLALRLCCDEPVLGPPPDPELFPSTAGQREGLLRLLERLQARLGPDGVQRLADHPDHRPECATRTQPALEGLMPPPRAPQASPAPPAEPLAPHLRPRAVRPTWLLAEPVPLPERRSRPWWQGQPLRLLGGPERIESGWWETALQGAEQARADARDYFIAQTPAGELLWVYRRRLPPRGAPADAPGGWFLHGRFG